MKTKYTRKQDDFFAKYKHPLWQKKRLEIMELSGFRCGDCDCDDKTLNVHHKFYVKGRDPWEYSDDELICLCEECHLGRHQEDEILKDAVNRFRASGIPPLKLVGFIDGCLADGPIEIKPRSFEWIEGFAQSSQLVDGSFIDRIIECVRDCGGVIQSDILALLSKHHLAALEMKANEEYGFVLNRVEDAPPSVLLAAMQLLQRSGVEK